MNDTYSSIKKQIFQYATSSGSFTIPAISELTGYSVTAISQYVKQMKEEGLVETVALEPSEKRGRRASVYGICSGRFHFIGVDVKTFELNIGLSDFSGTIIKKQCVKEFIFENTHENLDELCSLVDKFIDSTELDRQDISGINFNIGGRTDSKEGTSASMYNFEEMQNSSLAEFLTDRMGITVFVENDTKAMTYGEYGIYGKDEWKNLLFVNIGWGLGMGIVINGELYGGSYGYSGEIGHIPAYDNKILCHCGKKGCMETEVSCAAISRKLTERIRNGESSCLSGKVRRGEKITTDDIIEATRKEDPLCIELVSRTGRELGRHLAGIINIFNPDAIIIGGKLSSVASYYFLQHTSLAIKQYSLNLMSRNVAVETSKLGDDAGIVGACLIARNRFFFN